MYTHTHTHTHTHTPVSSFLLSSSGKVFRKIKTGSIVRLFLDVFFFKGPGSSFLSAMFCSVCLFDFLSGCFSPPSLGVFWDIQEPGGGMGSVLVTREACDVLW